MTCPICGAATAAKFRPFCSGRCADIDLAKWLNGSYAVPSQDQDEGDAALATSEDAAEASRKTH